MANIVEANAWEAGIYQLEESDVVQGGANGIDNLQAKQLAARTNYLKTAVEGLGADKQPADALLTAIAALVTSADKGLVFTGPDTVALFALSAYMRGVLGSADQTAARAALGAASQADINAAIAALVAASPATLDTLNEIATALGNDPNFATTMLNALALKAPLASPALTGNPTAPTQGAGDNSTKLATTGFVQTAIAAISLAGYAQLTAAQTFTAKQTFAATLKLQQVLEKETITASAPTGTFDCLSQGIQYFTANAAANWTQNFRGDGATTLNAIMAVGESITVTVKATQGATPYYPNAHQIDGAAVVPKWLGGIAPTAGDANSVNVYTYTITKTAAATFTVLASKSKYA